MENVITDPAPVCRSSLCQDGEVTKVYIEVAEEGNRTVGRKVHGDVLVQCGWNDSGVGIIAGVRQGVRKCQ